MTDKNLSRCGYAAIVGRPNVGKSTLLNRILGSKISIVSAKPQTTRFQVLGIKTEGDSQVIYIDTPGLHQDEKSAMNRYMNRLASAVIPDADVLVFVIEALKWTDDDELVLSKLKKSKSPVILVVNKVDTLADKKALLPFLESINSRHGDNSRHCERSEANQNPLDCFVAKSAPRNDAASFNNETVRPELVEGSSNKPNFHFTQIIPISATRGENLQELEQEIAKHMPLGPHFYPDEQITDKTLKFQVAEIVREKVILATEQELPYCTTVEVEAWTEEEKRVEISVLIWVEREGQKLIVIGKKGERLKWIGIEARKEIEALLKQKIFLRLWVKVKEHWTDDDKALRQLGYT